MLGNCWDSVTEEGLLTQFASVADYDSSSSDYNINIGMVDMATLRGRFAALGARDYSTAEMTLMLTNEDTDGDQIVTSLEYVVANCPPPPPEPPRASVGNDICQWSEDGACDVPQYCPAGSDVIDCAPSTTSAPAEAPDACRYAGDGEVRQPHAVHSSPPSTRLCGPLVRLTLHVCSAAVSRSAMFRSTVLPTAMWWTVLPLPMPPAHPRMNAGGRRTERAMFRSTARWEAM